MIKHLKSTDSMAVEELIKACYRRMTFIEYAIDIGANVGFHTTGLSKIKALKKLMVVEANPNLTPSLKKMTRWNRKLTVLERAVAPAGSQEVIFKLSDLHQGRGGIKGLHIWEKINPELVFEEVTVQCVTLDDMISSHLGGRLDFVKMDIEGPEVSILVDAQRFWQSNAVCVMENSVHGPAIAGVEPQEWIRLVRRKSYQLFDFDLNPIEQAEDLFNYNHVWLVPRAREQAFLETCQAVYRQW